MFTGIIEDVGEVTGVAANEDNLDISVKCSFWNELKIDQSVAHNGVCLTVVDINKAAKSYRVTAVKETLLKTNLGMLEAGGQVNLERAMKLNDRLDGHLVQGHVDVTATCEKIEHQSGSWNFTFSYDKTQNFLVIEKGSITINGVSLTTFNIRKGQFSVTIIPYTYENTTFNQINEGDKVNLEFDLIGKYVYQQNRNS